MIRIAYDAVHDGLRAVASRRSARHLAYVPILGLALIFMFARAVLMARLLSVHEFGQYSAAILVSSTFCMLGCLGLQPMLQRDMPIMLVRNRERRGVLALFQCIVVAGGCFLAASAVFMLGLSLPGYTRAAVLAGLVHGLSQQVFLIATVESRSRGQSVRYAGQNLIRGLLVLAGSVTVAIIGGSALSVIFSEAFASIALTVAILLGICRSVQLQVPMIYRLSIRRLAQVHWRSAAALLVVTVIGFVLLSADRWIATQTLSQAQFAQYSFAWTLLTIAQAMQILVNASVFPWLARSYASADSRRTFSLCLIVSGVLLTICVVLSIPAILLIDFGIVRWFPAYHEAVSLVALFVAVGSIRIADFWSSFMIIVGRERELIGWNVIAVGLSFLLWIGVVRPWSGLRPGIWDIGVLAALLSGCNFILTAAAAWRLRLA